MLYKTLVTIWLFFPSLIHGYCWQIGWNPYFTGPPVLRQVDISTISVSWKGLVKNLECADQFVVKYWPIRNPNDYKVNSEINIILNW